MRTSAFVHRLATVFANLLITLFCITCIFPVFWMIVSSVKTETEFYQNIMGLPSGIQFRNYVTAVKLGKMDVYAFNSAYVVAIAVSILVPVAFVSGYVFSRFRFWGRSVLYLLLMSGMLIPIHALLIPEFILFNKLNLIGHWYTLVIPNIAFNLPIAIFLIDSFVKTIPRELEEAAMIDGSGFYRTMLTIIQPICRPVIATVVILAFLAVWNEFPFALVLINRDSLKTVPIGLANFIGPWQRNYTGLMAALCLAMLPVLIVYSFLSRRIIQGMTTGMLKG